MRISDWSSDVCSSDLIGINRHTITPNGWTHEQFNTKVLRKPDGSQVELAREFGFNDYQKVDDIDFQPAYDYWKATSGFWAQVRARWDGFLSQQIGRATSELQSLMRISYAVFRLKKKKP